MTDIDTPFLGFDDLFASIGVLGHEFSPKLSALDGQVVTMRGYLAPADHHETDGPLVLTSAPVAICSDCGSGHDWPEDAVFVFPAEGAGAFTPGQPVEVRGRLEHGLLRLEEANSLVRLRDARWDRP